MISLNEFQKVLPHFRRSSELLQMRKRCRLDIESHNCEDMKYEKGILAALDVELVRRGLMRKKL